MSTLQPRDLILKRQDVGDRAEYLLYQYDGSPALKQVGGPRHTEAEALYISLQTWAAVGDVLLRNRTERAPRHLLGDAR